MHFSRLAAATATGAAALALTLGPTATAWADEVTPTSPAASPNGDSMDGMDMGSMPGMDHDATPMPGMEHEHTHGSSTTASRPRAMVLGGFVLVNGAGMVTALILRRRGRNERDRKRTARQHAGTPSGGKSAAADPAVVPAVLEGTLR